MVHSWFFFISVKKKSGSVDRFLANDSLKCFSKEMDNYKNEVGWVGESELKMPESMHLNSTVCAVGEGLT